MTTEPIVEEQVPVVEAPKPITWDDIDAWDGPTMARKLADPKIKQEVESLVALGRPDKRAIAAAQAQAEEDAEAARIAQEAQEEQQRQEQLDIEAAATAKAAEDKAEADRIAAEEAAKAAAEAAKPKKIVVEYQARDEAGNPIGRPTHLEAASWEEMSEKQKTAHIEATRALDRLKKRKETAIPKKEEVVPARMTDEEAIAVAEQLRSDDPDVALAAQRKIDADAILKERLSARQEKEDARQEKESFIFMKRHLTDFYPCTANGAVLSNYLSENKLEWNADNLEIAFAATESQLAPVPEAPAPVVQEPVPPVENTTATAPPAEAAPVAPVVPAAPPAAAINPPAAPVRKVPNGGIVPGETLTGRTQVAKPAGLTMKDIAKWDGPTMRKEMESSPKKRAEIMRVVSEYEAAKKAKQVSS